jgi:hypothetical protein
MNVSPLYDRSDCLVCYFHRPFEIVVHVALKAGGGVDEYVF